MVALLRNELGSEEISDYGGLIRRCPGVVICLAVILFGLVVLYMAMVRERRLNRLKSEFIANTSHELKTPLALIRMFSELLTMSRVTDEGNGFDPCCVPDPTCPANILKPEGRGIFLMRKLLDEVHFNDQGHAVPPVVETHFVQELAHQEDSPPRR